MARERVPVGLHSELSEYSSLLRALRTSHTLDLSEHLAAQSSLTEGFTGSAYQLTGQLSGDVPKISSVVPLHDDGIRITSSTNHSETKTKRKAAESIRASNHERDLWTRWPLLPSDVYTPEFPIEDEVNFIAEEALKALRDYNTKHNGILKPTEYTTEGDETETNKDKVDDDGALAEENFPPMYLQMLTADTKIFLFKTLDTLSQHIPLHEKSLRDRLKPMNWESILDVVSCSGDLEPSTIQRSKERLEALYGMTHSRADERAQIVRESKRKVAETYQRHTKSLFLLNFPSQSSTDNKPKRKRKKRNDHA